MVAESTEILRPITQLGCAQACSGVTAARLSSGAARNGPPEAVSTIFLTKPGLGKTLEDGVVLAVDRQELGAGFARRAHHERPGHHQRFLVGEQHALAGARRGERRGEPGGADDAGHHRMAVRMRHDLLERRVARQQLARRFARIGFPGSCRSEIPDRTA